MVKTVYRKSAILNLHTWDVFSKRLVSVLFCFYFSQIPLVIVVRDVILFVQVYYVFYSDND